MKYGGFAKVYGNVENYISWRMERRWDVENYIISKRNRTDKTFCMIGGMIIGKLKGK